MRLENCAGKRLLWGMTPQRAFQMVEILAQEDIEREKERQRELTGAWFYINVWNCQAQLLLYEQEEKGTGQTYPIEDSPFTSEELEQALWDQGGAINMSGWYALPLAFQERIKTFLECGRVKCAQCGREFWIPQEAAEKLACEDIRKGMWTCGICENAAE
ncbi:MAG: hypothetical protein ACOY58_07760 [Candidatus Micrarchaeota archaeon]